MKKGSLTLITISVIIVIIILFLVINLTHKNNILKFISDDSRQITLAQNIYKEILDENSNNIENINIDVDKSVFINFITYNHYVISHENIINDILENYTFENSTNNYTLSNEFDLDKLKLTVSLKKNDSLDIRNYTYKLKIDKKNNTIKYKLVKTDFSIE